MMKCCIVGAGAIGGHLAVKLRRAGHAVAVIARGAFGGVIYSANEVLRPGVLRNDADDVRATRALLVDAGLAAPAVAEIRASLSAGAVATDAAVQETMLRMLRECLQVAAASGYDVARGFDFDRWTKQRVAHKPSMLQDYEAGRPMEIGEIVLAPLAFARAAGLATPTLGA